MKEITKRGNQMVFVEFELNYKDGKKEGLQKRWYENGQLKYEENYKDRLISKKEWDKDGNLISTV